MTQSDPGTSMHARLLTPMTRVVAMLVFLSASVCHADTGLFEFQKKLADRGNAEAQFKVGEMYETGFGVGQDMDKARQWINKAASQGHEVAGHKLLYWDLKQNGITDTNRGTVGTLKKKAEEGDSYAQFYVGKMYAYGVGFGKNQELALTMLNRSAVQGVIEAEREMDLVRQSLQQDEQAARRAEQKRQAEIKRKAELKRRQAEAERRKQLAAATAAEKARKQKADQVAAERREAERRQAELEQMQAADREAEIEEQRLRAEREKRRQELLAHRRKKEEERRAALESDPCSGKSARLLSTCR